MIEKFYASHIKNTLDASAINVRKSKAPKVAKSGSEKPKRGWKSAVEKRSRKR
jgi:hypothetical protein